uniref:CSON007362 protein n=1 Tax=Culicoides sonorensis TaxID=179676 RepID=A0A336LJK1_CULSO
MAEALTEKNTNEADLKELERRMELVVKADPTQFQNTYTLKRYLKAFKTVDEAFQETACKKCFEEIDNLLIVFDMNQFNLSFLDNKLQLTKNLVWLLSRHFPERLGHCLILNSSTVFIGVYQIIRGWLDEATTNKIVFINTEEELCKYLIPDILPDNM